MEMSNLSTFSFSDDQNVPGDGKDLLMSKHLLFCLTKLLICFQSWLFVSVYLSAIVAILIISISSICGILVIPLIKGKYYKHMINMLVGLAFGAMVGDAILDLFPIVLGIHSHSRSSKGNDDESPVTATSYSGLMTAIIFTIYVLYLFEIVSDFIDKKMKHEPQDKHLHANVSDYQSIAKQLSEVLSTTALAKATEVNDHFDLVSIFVLCA